MAYIASTLGASRASVYSWFLGKNVSNAYRKSVEQLLRDITTK